MADVAAKRTTPIYQRRGPFPVGHIVNKKYYVTAHRQRRTAEGFGPDYSLRNGAYCESCSTCGLIFFQYKMNLALPRRQVCRLVRGVALQRPARRDRSGRPDFLLRQSIAGRRSHRLARLPVLRRQHPPHLADDSHLDVCRGKDGLYVNLFIGSAINVDKVSGPAGSTSVQMVQRTDYPWSGNVSIIVNPRESMNFTVYVRVPNRNTSALYTQTPPVSRPAFPRRQRRQNDAAN